ncbi:peptide/nickel transport system permease protein [Deinobacterium chartae]|uniref:Peptide/nickel transport system permease protein n=1 Tax=Deinobacterium chartae TaxID=521158 RepID=A0A841I115_9DEIO|nr:ABC transporter permease [Deinobacterium chartae]MBB6098099.1 peptide/nickel transport system permease protein [Deinobacterium chartae]
MFPYLIRQGAASLLVLFVVLSGTFFLIQAAPGSLGILADPNLDPEVRATVERSYGLDQPVLVQYAQWLGRMLQGDLSSSFNFQRPVLEMILERLPATLLLGITALVLTVVIGFVAGVTAARFPGSPLDQALSFLSFVGLATPSFWLGILLILLFSVRLGWLPGAGMQTVGSEFSLLDRLSYLVLPAVVLASTNTAELMRYIRSSWLENMHQDYVRTARSKGLPERQVQLKHILRNALIPILTIVGLSLPRLVGGAAVIEALFAWPGIGSMAVNAAIGRDTPLILGVTLFVSAAVIASNLLIDLLYGWIDPRIRY